MSHVIAERVTHVPLLLESQLTHALSRVRSSFIDESTVNMIQYDVVTRCLGLIHTSCTVYYIPCICPFFPSPHINANHSTMSFIFTIVVVVLPVALHYIQLKPPTPGLTSIGVFESILQKLINLMKSGRYQLHLRQHASDHPARKIINNSLKNELPVDTSCLTWTLLLSWSRTFVTPMGDLGGNKIALPY